MQLKHKSEYLVLYVFLRKYLNISICIVKKIFATLNCLDLRNRSHTRNTIFGNRKYRKEIFSEAFRGKHGRRQKYNSVVKTLWYIAGDPGPDQQTRGTSWPLARGIWWREILNVCSTNFTLPGYCLEFFLSYRHDYAYFGLFW